MRRLALLAALALGGQAAQASAQALRFVACPVYRDADAGKKSGCWLADDPASGVRYDITQSANKPDWNFAVLVEGRVAEGASADICGGTVLEPVRVSILAEPCTRAMLPAEGHPGRKFVLPERNVRPLYAKRDPVPRPYAARDFTVPFDFGRDFVIYQLGDYYLDRAVNYALDIGAGRIEITGFAATTPSLVSGRTLVEPLKLARSRAERAREWMRLRGIPADRIKIAWRGTAAEVPGSETEQLGPPSLRRVDIRILP